MVTDYGGDERDRRRSTSSSHHYTSSRAVNGGSSSSHHYASQSARHGSSTSRSNGRRDYDDRDDRYDRPRSYRRSPSPVPTAASKSRTSKHDRLDDRPAPRPSTSSEKVELNGHRSPIRISTAGESRSEPSPDKRNGFLKNRFVPISDSSASKPKTSDPPPRASRSSLSSRRVRLDDSTEDDEDDLDLRDLQSRRRRKSIDDEERSSAHYRRSSTSVSSRPPAVPSASRDPVRDPDPPRKRDRVSRWDAPAPVDKQTRARSPTSPSPVKPPIARPPTPPLAPDFYKPAGTRDFFVTYDPTLESGKKGKELQYRYDGQGIDEVPKDPRTRPDKTEADDNPQDKHVKSLTLLSYPWDKNSPGPPPPPPPSAVLVTGFPGSVTSDQLHRHFSDFGRIEKTDYKMDPQTGGVLSVCWIKFFDEAPRKDTSKAAREKFEREKRKGFAQDGNSVALEAVAKANGAKIGQRMLMSNLVLKVVLDGDGKLTKAAADAEIKIRHAPPPPPPPPVTATKERIAEADTERDRRDRDRDRKPAPPSTPPAASSRAVDRDASRSAPRICHNVSRYGYCRWELRGCMAYHPPNDRSPEAPRNGTADSYVPARASDSRGGVSSAVAAAVEAAKRRIATRSDSADRDKGGDRSDASSDSEFEKEDDRVYFHRANGRPSPRDVRTSSAWQASPRLISERLNTKNRPYVSVLRSDFAKEASAFARPPPVTTSELERHFGRYSVDEVLADALGWYITFRYSDGARRAYDELQMKTLMGVRLRLNYHDPSRRDSVSPTKGGPSDFDRNRPRKTSGWTDRELVEEATELVIKDLLSSFKADLKSRVVAGRVSEHVTRWDANGRVAAIPSPSKPSNDQRDGDVVMADASAAAKSISSLPSFARRKARESAQDIKDRAPKDDDVRRTKPARIKPEDETSASEADEDEQVVRRPLAKSDSKKATKDASRKAVAQFDYTSSEGEDESDAEPLQNKKKKKDSTVHIRPHSGPSPPSIDVIEPDDDNLGKDDSSEQVSAKSSKATSKKKAPAKKRKGEAKKQSSKKRADDAMQVDDEDEAGGLPTPAPTDDTTSTKRDLSQVDSEDESAEAKPLAKRQKRDERAATPDPFDAGLAADAEDLFFLKQAIERPRTGFRLEPTPPPDEDDVEPPRHLSGAARTEGYYKITAAEKMANRSSNNKGKVAVDASAAAVSGVAVSRLARANTRGLVRGMEMTKKVAATDTDVLKFNQLRTRKKQLTFARSGIEGYGLFAMEHIPAGEMVIEYVGELIRQQVADRREKAYERQGIGSSYLFRVDEDLVVDATKKGNLGRLINHCCVPNCTARIITIGREKKIVIYAKTNIEPGDEVTYDYHFPREEIKIPCLCGHPLCRKFLN